VTICFPASKTTFPSKGKAVRNEVSIEVLLSALPFFNNELKGFETLSLPFLSILCN